MHNTQDELAYIIQVYKLPPTLAEHLAFIALVDKATEL